MDLKNYIRDVPDFPHAGILYRDITPLLAAPSAFKYAIDQLSIRGRDLRAEAIMGIDARGFLFGAGMALALNLPFIPIRKPGKLPSMKIRREYSLEYGVGELEVHRDALQPGEKVVIVDDLLATGGTAEAGAKLAEELGASVVGALFVVELVGLKGRERLSKYEVQTLISYS